MIEIEDWVNVLEISEQTRSRPFRQKIFNVLFKPVSSAEGIILVLFFIVTLTTGIIGYIQYLVVNQLPVYYTNVFYEVLRVFILEASYQGMYPCC